MRRSAAAVFLAFLGVGWVAAESNWGPATGSMAPTFSLPDQNGVIRTLSSLLQENGAILVFYRSADW